MLELKTLLLLLLFLLIEILALLLVLVGLIYQQIASYFKAKIYAKKQEIISKRIVFYLQEGKSFTHDRIFSHPSLLSILESFDRRVKGEEWETLKQKIIVRYLLKAARKRTKSFFWRKRNFAARVFALFPLLEDETLILSLLNDPVFLVKGIAAIAAVKLPSVKGIELILEQMAQFHGYYRCFYRDILLQGSHKAFTLMMQIALQNKAPKIHLACLEVFSGKTVALSLPFLLKDLRSKDPQILLAALKTLERNPLKNAEEIFLSFLTHSNEEIRMEAAKGLKGFIDEDSFNALGKTLLDPSWRVRLQAARSLKEMGEKGEAILKRQDPKTSRTSYEIAQYALDFLG